MDNPNHSSFFQTLWDGPWDWYGKLKSLDSLGSLRRLRWQVGSSHEASSKALITENSFSSSFLMQCVSFASVELAETQNRLFVLETSNLVNEASKSSVVLDRELDAEKTQITGSIWLKSICGQLERNTAGSIATQRRDPAAKK